MAFFKFWSDVFLHFSKVRASCIWKSFKSFYHNLEYLSVTEGNLRSEFQHQAILTV